MIFLDIQLEVPAANQAKFLAMYSNEYVPALRRQRGYVSSVLLRAYPPGVSAEIDATAPHLDMSMQLWFESEEDRRRWVATDDHQRVWSLAAGISESARWAGYDVVARDGD